MIKLKFTIYFLFSLVIDHTRLLYFIAKCIYLTDDNLTSVRHEPVNELSTAQIESQKIGHLRTTQQSVDTIWYTNYQVKRFFLFLFDFISFICRQLTFLVSIIGETKTKLVFIPSILAGTDFENGVGNQWIVSNETLHIFIKMKCYYVFIHTLFQCTF